MSVDAASPGALSFDGTPFDAIVVGSGPAGTFAARALAGHRVLVLDVGEDPESDGSGLDRNLYDARCSGEDLFADVLGRGFESLHNVDKNYLSPKLKAPLVRHVTRSWREHTPVDCHGFDPVQSFARGGLANVWGGGCFRFTDDELRAFPFGVDELERHYDDLTEHIGITGVEDDLEPWFGTSQGCLPPLRTSCLGADLLRRYARKRGRFRRDGVHLGLPRMAVLSQPYRGRAPYDYQGLEFFKSHIPAIYNPAFTLEELCAEGRVEYRRPFLVERFHEEGAGVRVEARHTRTGERAEFRARKLVLAAGALGSAKLALASRADHETRLPLLDNLISYVPLVGWRHVGRGVERESLPIQLNVVCELEPGEAPVQASLYGVTATLWNDILFDLPLACRDNMRLLRHLLPAMVVVQLFYPDERRRENTLRLDREGRLELVYEARPRGEIERRLLRAFRSLGFFGAAGLCKYPDPGNSFHYAGCLPMRHEPGAYETHPDGRLHGTRHVFVADAAGFSSLPSKNLTFTIMANAQRIGERVARACTMASEPGMRVCITGVSGFLGSALPSGSCDRDTASWERSATQNTARPGCQRACDRALAVGRAVSPAAARVLRRARALRLRPGGEFEELNVRGTLVARDAAREAGVARQIFLSSFSARPDAASSYGRMKHALEEAFDRRNECVLRPGLVVGPGGLFAKMLRSVQRLPVVPLPDGGRRPVPILGHEDLLKIIGQVLEHGAEKPLNLCYSQQPRLEELLRAIAAALGKRRLWLPFPTGLAILGLKIVGRLGLRFGVDSENLTAYRVNEPELHQSDYGRFGLPEPSLMALVRVAVNGLPGAAAGSVSPSKPVTK